MTVTNMHGVQVDIDKLTPHKVNVIATGSSWSYTLLYLANTRLTEIECRELQSDYTQYDPRGYDFYALEIRETPRGFLHAWLINNSTGD